MWGYDRDEVDQLLASVVVSIERLQRRRQRDGEAIERATSEAARASERAKRAEHQRDELANRIELADQAVAEANRRAERLVAQAEERAAQAERARLALEGASSAWDRDAALPSDVAPGASIPPGEDADSSLRLPLAVRAARVLLAEARARAAAIEAEAVDAKAEAQQRTAAIAPGGPDHSRSSGSSATIHS
jgi:chromosome segregation ATPase